MDLVETYTDMVAKIMYSLVGVFVFLTILTIVLFIITKKKKCPFCNMKIDKDSIYCKYCGKGVR